MAAEAAPVIPLADGQAKDHALVSAQIRDSIGKGNVVYEKRPVLGSDGQPGSYADMRPMQAGSSE